MAALGSRQDNQKNTHKIVLDNGLSEVATRVDDPNLQQLVIDLIDAITGGGTPFYEDYSATPVGMGPHTLISFTVAASTEQALSHLEVSCRVESIIEIKKNGDVIGTMMTGASRPSAKFDWLPRRNCVFGDTIEVILTKRAGAPDTKIGAHLMGISKTV